MARAIFRSGRVAHVWHRHQPERSGFYARMRGGRELGPYRERDAAVGMLTSVNTSPRLGESPGINETWGKVTWALRAIKLHLQRESA